MALFEHEEKLSTATKRQQEIVAALDITKNQASAKVDEGDGEALASLSQSSSQTTVPTPRAASNGIAA